MKRNNLVMAHTLAEVLQPTNLEPYYDRSLLPENIADISNTDHLRLRGQMSFYPVVTSCLLIENEPNPEATSYIPIGDFEAVRLGTYMGILVSKSKILPDSYVLQNIPQPLHVPLPTRIMTTFCAGTVYPPIQGFLLHQKPGSSNSPNANLLVGDSLNSAEIRNLSLFKNRQFISRLLFNAVQNSNIRYTQISKSHVESEI